MNADRDMCPECGACNYALCVDPETDIVIGYDHYSRPVAQVADNPTGEIEGAR